MDNEINLTIKKSGDLFILYCDELKIDAEGLTLNELFNDFMQQIAMDVKMWDEYGDLPEEIKDIKITYKWLFEGII